MIYLVINNIDLTGTYATAQALATHINAVVPNVNASIQNFEFFADAVTQFSSECHSTDSSTLKYIGTSW